MARNPGLYLCACSQRHPAWWLADTPAGRGRSRDIGGAVRAVNRLYSDRCEDGEKVTSVARRSVRVCSLDEQPHIGGRRSARRTPLVTREIESRAARRRSSGAKFSHQKWQFFASRHPFKDHWPERTIPLQATGRTPLYSRGMRVASMATVEPVWDHRRPPSGRCPKVGGGSATRRGPPVREAEPERGERLSSRGGTVWRPPGTAIPVRRVSTDACSPRGPGVPVRPSITRPRPAPAGSIPPARPYPQPPATAAAAAMAARAAAQLWQRPRRQPRDRRGGWVWLMQGSKGPAGSVSVGERGPARRPRAAICHEYLFL